MHISTSVPAGGLYTLKPAFQRLLGRTADGLANQGVHPDVLTGAAVGVAVLGGLALGTGGLWLVPLLACVRLTLNALDGMVAVRLGLARPWGKVLNELADRLADLAFFGPLLLLPALNTPLVVAALVSMLLVSYLGVLAEAAGAGRQYGGLMGKADRMLWLGVACVASAATSAWLPLQALPAVLLVGGLVTLVQRGIRTHAAV